MPVPDSRQCASLLKALVDETRLRIVRHLFGGRRCVSELAEALAEDEAKISHHLGVLRHTGVVEDERAGRFVYYRLHPVVHRGAETVKEAGTIDLGCCSVSFRANASLTDGR